ncbi:MAG: polysaccharide biosynthesis C-terminal domain-containing protein [Bacilli bacterium]|nr:polysaccharide biosynthesis C-terminal domain-containing protein [Bacilli bacterium]
MKVSISEHFTYKKIFKITIAPILMMIFISLYSVIDGICITNLPASKQLADDAFAGVNLIYPITTVIGGFGMLFGAGGSALIGKLLGQKKNDEARQAFTNVIITAFVVGAILSIIGYFIVEPFAYAMADVGSGDFSGMIQEAINYGRILMICQFLFIVQNMFHTLFVVDEKPHLGFIFSVAAGVTNIVFDVIFIGPCNMGATGAAIATVMGYAVGAIGPVLYFIFNKTGTIYFVKTKFDIMPVLKSTSNGLSEFINFAAMAVSGISFNYQLLKYYPGKMGQMGVEVYGVIMYVILIFVAIFLGYSHTMSPVVSYNLGANNKKELSNVLKKSLIIIGCISVIMLVLGESLSTPIALIFSTSEEMTELTTTAMRLWSISFLFSGFALYGATFFVGLNNGLIALIIAIVRSIVLSILFVFTLPIAMGPNGIWLTPMCHEAGGAILALILIFAYRKKYGYHIFGKTNQNI